MHARVKSGQPAYGMAAVGEGKDTEGSDWIVQALDRADDRRFVHELLTAVRAENATLAVHPAHEVHEVEHDLSQTAYGWLAQRGGLLAGAAGHHE